MYSFESIGGGLSVAVDRVMRVQEDALLLHRFAAAQADDRACDLGTGNGILPLLWCRREAPAVVTAVERETAFCAMVKAALDKHRLHDRVRLIEADWNDEGAMPPAQSMTLVTCNPPFFSLDGSRPSPDPLRDAMRREDAPDALFTLCRAAARLLTEDGRFCLCHRPARLLDVIAALDAAGLSLTRMQSVQSQDGKAPHLLLLEAKRHGALRILPALITGEKGQATAVYRRLYGEN